MQWICNMCGTIRTNQFQAQTGNDSGSAHNTDSGAYGSTTHIRHSYTEGLAHGFTTHIRHSYAEGYAYTEGYAHGVTAHIRHSHAESLAHGVA